MSDTTLKTEALSGLRSCFADQEHHPSPAMWEGIEDLLDCLQKMADGDCPPKFYLSSLDPGVGKTQTVVHFLRALLRHPGYSDVGVLIGVARLDEVLAYAAAADLPEHKYAILTSDEALNYNGSGDPWSTQVLFTTQQMIEKRTRGELLADTEVFHFKGRPRAVRVWDESMVPAQPLTVRRDALLRLVTRYRLLRPDFASDLETFALPLNGVLDGQVVEVSDLGSNHKLDQASGLSLVSDAPSDEQEAARVLWSLSGKTVTIRHDGVHKGTLVSYVDHLPADLAPIVILDASGRVRATYRWWDQRRGDLVRLKTATKNYRNLTIHVWQEGGGKSAFRNEERSRVLLQGIANTINEKPDQEWLVVCHKIAKRNLEQEIRELVSIDKSKLHFITWGNHQAINSFVNVPNVILAGTLFYPVSAYEALGRAAADYPATEGELTERRERAIRATEQHHLVLQALCRGTVRKCVGDTCAPCDAYVIASVSSGLPNTLKDVFPGCWLEKWQPVEAVLTGKVKEAANYILGKLATDPKALVSFSEVSKATGMSAPNFRKNVRQHEDFQDAMASNDVVERSAQEGKQPRHFGRGFFYWFGEEYIEKGGLGYFDYEEWLKERRDRSDLEEAL